ncbi:MAG: TadE/TadG family type IV pilus assembly protein [Kineosporiaceae bacterium]
MTQRRTPPPGRWTRGGDVGSASLELVVVAPALLLTFGVVIAGGRIAIADQAVEAAASEAARTASLARSATEASTSAQAAATATLAAQSTRCTAVTVSVDTSQFARPVGTPATVTASVTCVLGLEDVGVPGIPGTRVLTATRTSPLDTFRER